MEYSIQIHQDITDLSGAMQPRHPEIVGSSPLILDVDLLHWEVIICDKIMCSFLTSGYDFFKII